MLEKITAEENVVMEWNYTSGQTYADPFNDVEVDVVVRHSDGDVWRVPAYWAGGRVRTGSHGTELTDLKWFVEFMQRHWHMDDQRVCVEREEKRQWDGRPATGGDGNHASQS